MTVPTEHLLALAAILFCIGVVGLFTRRNLIVVLMCIELMLNAANLTFAAASRSHMAAGEVALEGPLFALFVIAVAAVEAAVGLALIIALFRRRQSVNLEDLDQLGEAHS